MRGILMLDLHNSELATVLAQTRTLKYSDNSLSGLEWETASILGTRVWELPKTQQELNNRGSFPSCFQRRRE
jgi:hypothetical protein